MEHTKCNIEDAVFNHDIPEAECNMYDNILVAYDDSEFSKAALSAASGWIGRNGGALFLVHAVYLNEEEFMSAPEQWEKRFQLGKEMCYRTEESVSNLLGKDVESLICEGEPYDVIADIARQKKADLIAIGTHGRKGLKKLFMGSVTSRVIALSPCDVLAVKRSSGDTAEKFKSILLRLDGSEFSKRALNRACAMAKIEGAEITALYALPCCEGMETFLSTELIKANLMREAQKITGEAKKIAMDQGVSIKTEILEGDVADTLINTAKRLGSDLIIGGTHAWSGIDKAIVGSIMESVIVNASCPVLIVK
jgi:nucleotide-binding universal stress UspA family protein